MTRRLFYLNAFLLLASLLLGIRLRMLWLDAREREDIVRLNDINRLKYRELPPTAQVQAVNAMNYSDVAMRMLFSRDRNPTVVIEVAPAPPPPPTPPFPKSNGVMMFSDPRIILTAHTGEGQKVYKFGDKVGDWEIVKFDSKTITLSWRDKEVTKDLADLVDNNPMAAPVQTAAPAAAGGGGGVTVKGSGGDVAAKPAGDYGNGTRSCAPGDSSPNGTVVDGMKKVVVANPFGVSCHWEPAK
jgi:hypothetical protein